MEFNFISAEDTGSSPDLHLPRVAAESSGSGEKEDLGQSYLSSPDNDEDDGRGGARKRSKLRKRRRQQYFY
jgi:hypothetical protein